MFASGEKQSVGKLVQLRNIHALRAPSRVPYGTASRELVRLNTWLVCSVCRVSSVTCRIRPYMLVTDRKVILLKCAPCGMPRQNATLAQGKMGLYRTSAVMCDSVVKEKPSTSTDIDPATHYEMQPACSVALLHPLKQRPLRCNCLASRILKDTSKFSLHLVCYSLPATIQIVVRINLNILKYTRIPANDFVRKTMQTSEICSKILLHTQ